MKVSIIIPYYDRELEIKNLLYSLSCQIYKDFEVIIVNDGSKDIYYDIINMNLSLNINYIYKKRDSNSGRASARNTGIEKSKGEILIFLDADQIVDPFFVQNYVDKFDNSTNKNIIQFSTRKKLLKKIDLLSEKLEEALYEEDTRKRIFEKYKNIENINGLWHLFYSHNIALYKSDLIKYGGFDTSFKGWGLEDVELAYRMKINGKAIIYNYQCESFNQYRTTINDDYEKYKQWLVNLNIFIKKYNSNEVSLQRIFDLYFDPDKRKVISDHECVDIWIMCFDLFELSLKKINIEDKTNE